MSKPTDRTIYKHPDGWADKRNGASRPARVYDTQAQAIAGAKGRLQNDGGGELTVQGMDGRFRSKDTIAPGNDPNPPRDMEH